MCANVCCTCSHRPCDKPCCAPQWRIKLVSADGLESPKLNAFAGMRPPRTYRTALSPVFGGYGETLTPTPHVLEYREYELTKVDEAARIATFREARSIPPAHKFLVCETQVGQWCSGCKTTHTSVAPRIVSGK